MKEIEKIGKRVVGTKLCVQKGKADQEWFDEECREARGLFYEGLRREKIIGNRRQSTHEEKSAARKTTHDLRKIYKRIYLQKKRKADHEKALGRGRDQKYNSKKYWWSLV